MNSAGQGAAMPARNNTGRLKREFINSLVAEDRWPAYAKFLDWGKRNCDHLSTDVRWGPKLRAGDPVPWNLIEAFLNYLRTRLHIDAPQDVAEQTNEKAIASPCAARKPDPWLIGWARLLTDYVLGRHNFDLPTEAFATRSDIKLAALLQLTNLGRKMKGSSISEAEALRYGEERMGISLPNLTTWLMRLWEWDQHTLLFATVNDPNSHGGLLRVGVLSALGLSEEAYQRVRSGTISYFDLTESDCCRNSRRLLYHSIAAVDPSTYQSTRDISASQINCVCFMTAYFSPRIGSPGVAITGLGPKINPENIKRSYSLGFRDLDIECPRPKCELMEFAPPSDKPSSRPISIERAEWARDWAVYRTMLAIVGMYQDHQQ